MSSNRRAIVKVFQVELSCESVNLWSIEVLTHLNLPQIARILMSSLILLFF